MSHTRLPALLRAGAAGLLAGLLMAGLPAPQAGAGGPAVVRGTVVDLSTTKHKPVARQPIALELRRNGHTLDMVHGRTDTRGNFALPAPALPAGAQYTLITTYRRVPYTEALTARQAARPVQVRVYDTTGSDSSIAAMGVTIGVRRRGSGLAVIEEWLFTNVGTRTAVGAGATGRAAATFLLPPGASHVAVTAVGPSPASATIGGDGVAVNAILRPASGLSAASFHQLTYTFDLPAGSGHPTLLIPTRYLIGSLKVFAIGSRLVAPDFKRTTLAVGKSALPALETQAVAPGSTLAVGVDGPPVTPAPPAAVTPAPFPLAPVAVLIELGFGGLLLFGLFQRGGLTRRRDRQALIEERTRLVAAIAELDLLHARGAVADDDYQRRRGGEKRRLLDVARQLGE